MEEPRGVKIHEFESLCTLVNTVFRSNGVGHMEQQYPLLFAPENFDHLLVMVDDDVVVSHVGTLTREISVMGLRIPVISIGAVATYEAYRGQGLATRLMEEAICRACAQDIVLMFISGGRGLYTRLGAKRIGQYSLYTIHRNGLPSSKADICRAEAADMDEMLRLYEAESSRYVRSITDLRTVVDAEWICDREGETILIREGGRVGAYAGVQIYRSGRGDEILKVRLAEITGSRSVLLRALPALYDRYGVENIEILTTESDLELARLARSQGVSPKPQGFPGTTLVLRPERLLCMFENYITSVLGPSTMVWNISEELVIFQYGGQAHTIAINELGALIFGVIPPDKDFLKILPPGPLRLALESIFPQQLPWYGFNFV